MLNLPPSPCCSPNTTAADPGFSIQFRAGKGERALDCWIVRPNAPRPDALPLVAVHGITRGAQRKAEAFAARAAALGRSVIAPLFDEDRWNGYQRAVAPRRADLALLMLLQDLRAEGLLDVSRFDLFGFSGGSQFAHRFAMLYPHLIGRLSVCASGWWTFPDGAEFPYGLGGDWGARLASGLDRFLALDIAVSVGARDNRPDGATRSTPELDVQQGADRLARARAWTRSLRAAAKARDLPPPSISLTVLPDAGHDFARCVRSGELIDLTLPTDQSG